MNHELRIKEKELRRKSLVKGKNPYSLLLNPYYLPGFTLIELLIAIVIMSVISLVAVRILYNMVSYRSKQFAIEDTSSSFRDFVSVLSGEVRTAENVKTTSSSIEILNSDLPSEKCKTYSYDSVNKTIKKSSGSASPCTTGPLQIIDSNIKVNSFTITPIGSTITILNLDLAGTYKDSLGDRNFSYSTAIKKRT